MRKYEVEITAIDGSSDNGFSGMIKVYDEQGNIYRRKGISGNTKQQVKKMAIEYVSSLK